MSTSRANLRAPAPVEAGPTLPWRWSIKRRTLIVKFASPHQILSWAPLNGGFARGEVIANHEIARGDRLATEVPGPYLRRLMRELGVNPERSVAMMTAANVMAAARACTRRNGLVVAAWCTAGCSNALRVGDPATVENTSPGTINLIVAINQSLSDPAMVEAAQIATEARVLAVQEASIRSVRTGLPATGTGTDCIAIAAPLGEIDHHYCGKHTRLGELIGRAVLTSTAKALARSVGGRQ